LGDRGRDVELLLTVLRSSGAAERLSRKRLCQRLYQRSSSNKNATAPTQNSTQPAAAISDARNSMRLLLRVGAIHYYLTQALETNDEIVGNIARKTNLRAARLVPQKA
jgi:hypothetical protein